MLLQSQHTYCKVCTEHNYECMYIWMCSSTTSLTEQVHPPIYSPRVTSRVDSMFSFVCLNGQAFHGTDVSHLYQGILMKLGASAPLKAWSFKLINP